MIRSILVPLDGSDFAERALPLAASLARRAGATLHLAEVHHEIPTTGVGDIPLIYTTDQDVRLSEQAYLTDVARRIGPTPALKSTLLTGDVCDALKGYIAREGIDLVVMATHARGLVGRFFLGSVADDLAAQVALPVLLIPPSKSEPDLDCEPDLKSIILPLDGTKLAERAIEPALVLGKLFDAEFVLVRVIKPALLPAYAPEGANAFGLVKGMDQAAEFARGESEQVKKYLDEMAAKLSAQGARVRTHILVQENPAEGILADARAEHADLIALETHGRRGLSKLFMGSVADIIVRAGAMPVLVHHTLE